MKQLLSLFGALAAAVSLYAGDIIVYPSNKPVIVPLTTSPCVPGGYRAYINYIKPVSAGWGWAPDTNNFTTFTATDTNRVDTTVQYLGQALDSGCAPTSVQVPNPPHSPKYRFTVYFSTTNNLPSTTNYPLVLHNFLP